MVALQLRPLAPLLSQNASARCCSAGQVFHFFVISRSGRMSGLLIFILNGRNCRQFPQGFPMTFRIRRGGMSSALPAPTAQKWVPSGLPHWFFYLLKMCGRAVASMDNGSMPGPPCPNSQSLQIFRRSRLFVALFSSSIPPLIQKSERNQKCLFQLDNSANPSHDHPRQRDSSSLFQRIWG